MNYIYSNPLLSLLTSKFSVKFHLLLMVLFVFSFANVATAQTKTWNGSSDTNWTTGANWTPNGVPAAADDVVIPNGITQSITVNTAAVCKTFTMNGGNSTNTVTISVSNSLTVSGAVTIGAPTRDNRNKNLIVDAGTLTAALVTMENTTSNSRDCVLSLSTGTINISGNITMSGLPAENQVTFSNTGTLNLGGTMTGGGLTPSTGTVNYNNTGNQTVGSYNYNNLTLSNSGTKTFGVATTINNLLAIESGVVANLSTFTHTAKILTLGGAGPLSSSWGSTSSNPVATNTNDTFFALTSGKININGSVPYPAIDNNYASYSNGVSGQVAASSGEYANPPTNTLPGSLTLSAPPGSAFINVKFASYGSPVGASPNFTIGSCHAFNSRTVTTGLLGSNVATVPASGTFNQSFGDPCYGVVKSYNVVATYAQPFCTVGGVPTFNIIGSQPTGGNDIYAYLWEKSITNATSGYAPAAGINNAINYTVPANTVTATTWYRRTVTSGIYSDATIVIVQVVAGPPTIPTSFTTSAAACDGTVMLTVSGGSLGGSLGGLGGYAEFYTVDGTVETVLGTSNSLPASEKVSPTVGKTYYVRYRNSCSQTSSLSLTPTNTISITASPSATPVCFSTSVQTTPLAYTSTSGTPTKYSIIWNNTPANSFLSVNNASLPTNSISISVPANTPAGTYTGTLTVKNASNCVSFKNTFTLIVNAVTVSNAGPNQKVCGAGSEGITLAANAVGLGETGTWTGTGTFVIKDISSPTTTVTVAPGTSSTFTWTITKGSCSSASNVQITNNPTSPISGILNVCAGKTVTLTNTQGNGGTWSSATPAVATVDKSTGVVTGVSAGTSVITYINTLGCPSNAIVTVTAVPDIPSFTTTQPTCAVPTGVIKVSAPVGGISYTVTGTIPVVAGVTNTTGLFTGLAAGIYSLTANNNCGVSAVTNVTITSPVKTWNGSSSTDWNTPANWTPTGVPDESNCVTIPNVTKSPIILGTNFVALANNLTISIGGSLLVNPSNTIKVNDFVNVADGSLTFENNASLVQVNDNAINSGNISYKRHTAAVRRYDFTYWSSPVAPQTLYNLSPNTLSDKYFGFNSGINDFVPYNGGAYPMKAGLGYLIRAPQSFSITTATIDTAPVFVGKPNNGLIEIPLIKVDQLYLLGNPYPSALDADEFLKINNAGITPVLDGTLYFWTHNSEPSNAVVGDATYNYTSDDYASYNNVGGVGTAIRIGNTVGTAENSGNKPRGKIAAGQGFFVYGATGGTAIFNNNMRVAGTSGNNSQFFRTKNPKAKIASTIEKNRVWLNLTNTQGAFKQILVGYVTGATNEYDSSYDGYNFSLNKFIDFYSLLGTDAMAIQGRALPFNDSDIVPIGYSSTIAGDFSISIDELDGTMQAQNIFLEDKLLSSIHNLKVSPYTFNTAAGTFDDRFVLRYTDRTLGNVDFEKTNNQVSISKDKNELKIKSETEIIKQVTVFDLLGKKVFEKTTINSNEFRSSSIGLNKQIGIVKVTLANGEVISKKVVF